MSPAQLAARMRAIFFSLRDRTQVSWRWFRRRPKYQQAIAVLLILALLGYGLFRGGDDLATGDAPRQVALASVGELSGTASSVDFIGTVRSMSEADILAQTGGTVRSVRTRLGARVPAGFVIAELENASERAAVLQAEGAYDAAVAARSAQSLPDVQLTARNTYRETFTTLDITFKNQIDPAFFGGPTAIGPKLLITPRVEVSERLSRERARLKSDMQAYEARLGQAGTRDPRTLLDEAEALARDVQTFLSELASAANDRNAQTTAEQRAALPPARASVDDALARIAAARANLRSGSVSATASADASVKQALGALRAAQAVLERTFVRAPIAGQVNYLPVRVGDYVTSLQHVATVAQNGALEVVVYVPEANRDLLVAGGSATVGDGHAGVITSIAPALDPTNKQIEVHVAVSGVSDLVNGQSVRVSFPDLAAGASAQDKDAGPLLLPLSAVKLRASDRVVFSVDEDSRLVAHAVEVGDVRGDRIEIRTELPRDLRIVADARGLAEGERVSLATEAP